MLTRSSSLEQHLDSNLVAGEAILREFASDDTVAPSNLDLNSWALRTGEGATVELPSDGQGEKIGFQTRWGR